MTDARTLLLSDHEKDHARGDCECPCVWMAADADTLRQRVAALEGALREIADGDNGGGWGDLVAWMRGIADAALTPTPDR